MGLVMTNRARNTALSLLLALATALIAFAASPVAPLASASACGQAANTSPDSLRPGDARDAVLCLINKERSKAGLGGFDSNKKLQKAAQRHNDRMVGTGCFDHECSGEAELTNRLESVGYLGGGLTRWAYGENIAWGTQDYATPRSMVAAWMDSPGHRANILSSDFREIGIGFSTGTPDSAREDGAIYTTDFGLRVG